jgi:hypothetical protein
MMDLQTTRLRAMAELETVRSDIRSLAQTWQGFPYGGLPSGWKRAAKRPLLCWTGWQSDSTTSWW